jgi:alpha-amylase/alpha-mannosidase (GH57 family)
LRLAFDEGVTGIELPDSVSKINLQATFDLDIYSDLEFQKRSLADGLHRFENIFGRKARFFVPPNGPINNELLPIAYDGGIEFVSTPKLQKEVLGNNTFRYRFHYLGQSNSEGQIYLTRNAFFEPSSSQKDWVGSCLKQIEHAFNVQMPAIISTHRVNYVGGLSQKNASEGLASLEKLLQSILQKWPEVEFLTSTELGEQIRESKKNG